MSRDQIGLIILRLGLAVVFLWFGISQLLDVPGWVGWVPGWAITLTFSAFSPETIVLLNGAFETIAGTLLVLNLFASRVAFALAIHLVLVTIAVGYNEIGVRDFGLTAAAFALFFLAPREGNARIIF